MMRRRRRRPLRRRVVRGPNGMGWGRCAKIDMWTPKLMPHTSRPCNANQKTEMPATPDETTEAPHPNDQLAVVPKPLRGVVGSSLWEVMAAQGAAGTGAGGDSISMKRQMGQRSEVGCMLASPFSRPALVFRKIISPICIMVKNRTRPQ